MNIHTLRHAKHVLQFRRTEQGLSGGFNREPGSSSNQSLFDELQHGALASKPIELRSAATVKPVCVASKPASHHQELAEVSPDFHPESPLPRHQATASELTMHITIGADSVTTLRRIVIGSFGDTVAFMRIQSIDHAAKMKVCLCLTAPIADRVMDVIMHALPFAEFGRITRIANA